MVSQTNQQSLLSDSNPKTFSRVWNALIEPADSVQGDDRRRAKSVSALTLVFIPLALFTVLSPELIDLLNNLQPDINSGGIIGIIFIVSAYVVSRTKYFQIAAYLTVFTPFIAVLTALSNSDTGLTETSMMFLTLGVILSSLLLTSRDTLITGAISVIAIIVLYSTMSPASASASPLLTYTVVATGVLALISRIREQNIEALELAQNQLKEQIVQSEKARERAERSDQVKSAFLASMSHELRTPLNAIINFTRFVAKGTLGSVNDEQVETLNNVIISGKHLLNLINDVLDMAKIESGSLTLFVSDDVAVDDVIKEVSATGRALLDEKPVQFVTEVGETLPHIRGDHQRIRQILLNIVSNACKFTDAGSITIRAKQDQDDIIISVADTGHGIAKEDQEIVFEAFKQTDDGLRQGGGTGLGMPITKNLVEAHGGTILLESEPGKGSTFHIRLPIQSDKISPTLMTEV